MPRLPSYNSRTVCHIINEENKAADLPWTDDSRHQEFPGAAYIPVGRDRASPASAP